MSTTRSDRDVVVERTIEICAVPGPPLDEADRAAVVEGWWHIDGLEGVRRDDIGNVWACVRRGTKPGAVLVAAHLDTVFDRSVTHGATRDGDHLRGPGVGDDSVALAALSTLGARLPETAHAVWLVATVGEEGIGDLAGVRHALAHAPEPPVALVAIEGNYLGRICTTAVGSVRWRVEVAAAGGHSWEAAGAPNAVHAAAAVIGGITAMARPDADPKCAVNVGRIGGGEAVNARARRCWFDVDLRSDDPDALERLDHGLQEACVDAAAAHEVVITLEPLGRRPAGRIRHDHPLVVAAVAALDAEGVPVRFVAASTDANAAHAVGVPAIAIGITEGTGEHTEQEWIALEPIERGLRALAATVAGIAGVATTTGEVGP
jgi:tripeptide aminopeptidase